MRNFRLCAATAILGLGVCLGTSGCGGGSAVSPPPNPTITSVSISPPGPTTLAVNQTQQYTATVSGTGSFSSSVVWFVDGYVGGNSTVGTISSNGLYQAPASVPSPDSITVSAVSAMDKSEGASSAVTIGSITLTGSVTTAGPLAGANVTATSVNPADGSDGAILASSTTDANGIFSLGLPGLPTGPIRLKASGGTFTSVADGTSIPGTITESALVDTVTGPISGLAITPLTDFVNTVTKAALTSGGALRPMSSSSTSSITGAHAQANALVSKFYGLSASAVTENLLPSFAKSDIVANPDNFKVGLVVGSLATLGKKLASSSPDALVGALSQDFDDGKLDGKGSGPITLGGGVLPSTAGTIDFLLSLNGCGANCKSLISNGILLSDLFPAAASIATGVQTSTLCPRAFGMTPGSSAALATLSFDGHQYVFIAGRTQGIIVLDVTDPSNIPPPKAWTYLANTTFQQNFVGGVVPVVGTAPHAQVLAYAFALPHIALINAQVLATGTPGIDDASLVDFETDITINNPPPPFSDISTALIVGGIPDNGRKGVWLGTADGYSFFNLTTNTLGTTYPVDPNQQLAENIGGDIAHGQLLAGNYVGVQLIDLLQAKSFDMDAAFFNANIQPLATGQYVDANSVDTTLQVGIGTAEHVANSFFINLATLSENSANATFVPGANGFVAVQMATVPGTLDLTGASADPTSHLVLFSGDNSSWVAVGQLQDPASVPSGASWAGMTDWVFWNIVDSPSIAVNGDTYFGSSDPHVFGRMYNLSANKPFGYLLTSDDTFVVQVDMQGLLGMPRSTDATDPDAPHKPASDPAVAGFLTVIPVP